MNDNFEIIELKSHSELPRGVEFILYEPPFYGDELQEVASQFKEKFGGYPQTIYRIGKKLFVVRERSRNVPEKNQEQSE